METPMVKAVDKVFLNNEPSTNLRYERKFVFQNLPADAIIRRVFQNSFGFKEVFHQRQINNIYFDDANYNFYKQNVEGIANRKKLRLRWYGKDTFKIYKPTLEVKKRIGEVGDKNSYPLHRISLDLNAVSTDTVLCQMIENTNQYTYLQNRLELLHATLINTYERRYFLSFCDRYRITVDFNQAFYNPNYENINNSQLKLSDVVVELKYALEADADARQLSQQIGTRLSKNSKYVNGANALYHSALL